MPDPSRVVVDGTDEREPRRLQRRPPMLMAVGLMAVLAMAIVLFGYTSRNEEEAAASTTVAEAARPTEPRYGVTAVAPEFPDAVVAVVSDATTDPTGPVSIDHVLWPSESPEVVIPLLEARQPGPSAIDAAGTWVVVSTIDSETSLLDLSIGRRASIASIGNNANSFAFHDSTEGRLSYSVVEDGVWELRSVTGAFPPQRVSTDIPLMGLGYVAAWGDWGWAIQEFGSNSLDPIVWMLDPEATLVRSFPGVAFGSHPSGLVVVADDTAVNVIQVSNGASAATYELKGEGPLAAATISPDGSKVALLGFDGLVVISIQDGEILMEFEPVVGWAQAVWSSDSRFVMVPGPTGITIIDTATQTAVEGFPGMQVQALGVIPLSGS